MHTYTLSWKHWSLQRWPLWPLWQTQGTQMCSLAGFKMWICFNQRIQQLNWQTFLILLKCINKVVYWSIAKWIFKVYFFNLFKTKHYFDISWYKHSCMANHRIACLQSFHTNFIVSSSKPCKEKTKKKKTELAIFSRRMRRIGLLNKKKMWWDLVLCLACWLDVEMWARC